MLGSLLRFLDSDINFSGAIPAILVNDASHPVFGFTSRDDSTQPNPRPNLIDSNQLAVCEMFASFKPIPMHILQ
jgi:hypothetical protein